MDKKQIIVLIISIILSLALGMCLGIFLQSHNKIQVTKSQAVNGLSSKTVSSITVYGKVTGVNGRIIAINNLGDNLSVSMADNAFVYSITNVKSSGKNPATTSRRQILLNQVKIGDNINMSVQLLPIGQIEGRSIIVLP